MGIRLQVVSAGKFKARSDPVNHGHVNVHAARKVVILDVSQGLQIEWSFIDDFETGLSSIVAIYVPIKTLMPTNSIFT